MTMYYEYRDRDYIEYSDLKQQIISNGKYLVTTPATQHDYNVEDGLDVIVYASDQKCPTKTYKASLITKDGTALAEGCAAKGPHAAMSDLYQLTAVLVSKRKPEWESRAKVVYTPDGKKAFGTAADILL